MTFFKSLIRHDRRHNVSDFDLNLVTASISPSIQEVRELHALSPPLAGRYTLDIIIIQSSSMIIVAMIKIILLPIENDVVLLITCTFGIINM